MGTQWDRLSETVPLSVCQIYIGVKKGKFQIEIFILSGVKKILQSNHF